MKRAFTILVVALLAFGMVVMFFPALLSGTH